MDQSRVVSDLTVLGEGIIKPSLTESRRVTIGKKDSQVRTGGSGAQWRAPIKLDHFQVTLTETDEKQDYVVDWKFHREVLHDDKPRKLPIKLLFDRIQLNAMTYLGLYSGRSAWCKGNGQVASRVDDKAPDGRRDVECPCELLTQGKCKPHLRFQFHLEGMGIGEVAVFRSTGKHTISAILGSLAILKEQVAIALGTSFDQAPIADIPLVMEYLKKTVPDKEGRVRIIPVINVKCMLTKEEIRKVVLGRQEFYKRTADELQGILDHRNAIELARERDQTAKLLAPEAPKEAEAIAAEFHPESMDEPPPDVGPCKAKKEEDDLRRLEDASKRVLPASVVEAIATAEDEDLLDEAPPAPAPKKEGKKPAPKQDKPKDPPKKDEDWL
jgi:hypothetical protein